MRFHQLRQPHRRKPGDEIIAALIGSLCVLCGAGLTGSAARRQLCEHCLASLPWNDDACSAADGEHAAGHGSTSPISRTVVPLRYAGAAARWVLRAKRHGGLIEARVLGTLLAEAAAEHYPEPADRPDLLVPVPLSWRRLVRRGHNQAVLIALPVGRALGLPVARLAARRLRHTVIQPGLGRAARIDNLRGGFRARRRWQGETIAIVDDVTTTGATADALARCLLDAGAGRIDLWCATRAGND